MTGPHNGAVLEALIEGGADVNAKTKEVGSEDFLTC
jgi:hypothetical protein